MSSIFKTPKRKNPRKNILAVTRKYEINNLRLHPIPWKTKFFCGLDFSTGDQKLTENIAKAPFSISVRKKSIKKLRHRNQNNQVIDSRTPVMVAQI